ncbi:putative receptor protein kinase CRINKLY4 [Acorus calamus]|uniref:non-specific serine/threonine protein kinase n=1 Tax=Acorus calamus TaxID=4465 RepID=A0AAV9D310_ACOCL|nr:putative receptor protein kinase CRINKLY4 [Acorus calamus]
MTHIKSTFGYLFKAMVFAIFSSQTVSGLGSMSSIAVSYGEDGTVFCGLALDGSHWVSCYGSDASVVYGVPHRLPFTGLTGGDGFVCGLLMDSNQPYCWGNNIYIKLGVPQPIPERAEYLQISAGDNHLCALRKPPLKRRRNRSHVDCWGYNMTASHVFDGAFDSITAGSVFNCGLFARNRSVFCWGDDTSSAVTSLTPLNSRFRAISAGGFFVCGVGEGPDARARCWGQSLRMNMGLDRENDGYAGADVDSAPPEPMLSVVGGRFHACGIRRSDHRVVCWGFWLEHSVPPPEKARANAMTAGDYFTCGVFPDYSMRPLCWGLGYPTSIPMAVSPGLCVSSPCGPGYYEYARAACASSSGSRVCVPCSNGCRDGTYESSPCSRNADRQCRLNATTGGSNSTDRRRPASLQWQMLVAELVFAFVFILSVCAIACIYVRYKLRRFSSRGKSEAKVTRSQACAVKVRPEVEELKIRRAQTFTYEELERATDGFSEASQVGKGSFSCVFKGVLRDGTVVAVKRAITAASDNVRKSSKEFHTELDLLSRLNHAHLLNLLGYCEEGGERLLVYEYMANGSLHQHLHHARKGGECFDWVRRVTIAVQAARGIEYLHGYACPPVIHRDIKSSNILIDEEHNARVADFGLSLLGPVDSGSPLSELPAGTLGYLDPEYYRLHYLTTKSDIYSFGVLLLEILSGRKAIDMRFEECNIVEWAVPLIKAGDVGAVLDQSLAGPACAEGGEALKRIANVACKCVRMRGKERPSMDRVTTALERALAMLMGSPSEEQAILPTEVVLGSSRLHKKGMSNRSCSETTTTVDAEERCEFRAPSWITFPSVASSQRRRSSMSDGEGEAAGVVAGRNVGVEVAEEEIGPASPQQALFLQHNF